MGKIIENNEELLLLIKRLKGNDTSIVMVNGCFDLFHCGHLDLLKYAKKQGDILIIVVNSDKSIKNIKGDNRPVIPQKERGYILSSIIYTDYVVFFDGNTPAELIEIIKPDMIVKEKEYTKKNISEIDSILENNCKLIFYERKHYTSTSDIIKKIKLL
jgi:cytidyltransferase-related domain